MDKPRLRLVSDTDGPSDIEAIDLDPTTAASLARLGGVAAASAASVLAQMVRAPVPAAELDARVLTAHQAIALPMLQPTAPVRAHREIRGDLTGDLVIGQSEEMVSWLGTNVSSLGEADHEWSRQRLSDLAGISLAAFGLSLGRSLRMRLEPELSEDESMAGPDVALVRAVTEHRLAVVMQSRSPEQRSIGDFFFFLSEEDLSRLISAMDAGL